MRDDYIIDYLEENVRKTIRRLRDKEPSCLLSLYFPDLTQSEGEALAEEIEEVILYSMGIKVHVDF